MIREILLYLSLFFLILFLTPLVKKYSKKYTLGIAPANNRKIHRNTISQMGGVSIYISFVLFILFFNNMFSPYVFVVFFATSLIFAVGIVDDMWELSPKIKLVFQVMCGCLLFYGNVKIQYLPGIFSFVFTILWVVGITNSINLIDGIDGLAAGITLISAVFFAIFCKVNNFVFAYYLSLFLGVGAGGFLVFNFHPAKIFLGDGGAYLLGILLSIIPLVSFFEKISILTFVSPLLILFIPIFDTVYAVIRRIHTKKRVEVADKEHIHHKLLKMGLSQKKAVIILWMVHLIFGLIGITIALI